MSFSSQFIEVLDALCAKFGIVIDWTSQNVMPYLTDLATRLVNYEIWTSVAWIVILGVAFIVTWKLTKNARKDDSFGNEGNFICAWVACGIIGIIFVTITCVEIFDIIRALTIPEVVIYGFLKGLM